MALPSGAFHTATASLFFATATSGVLPEAASSSGAVQRAADADVHISAPAVTAPTRILSPGPMRVLVPWLRQMPPRDIGPAPSKLERRRPHVDPFGWFRRRACRIGRARRRGRSRPGSSEGRSHGRGVHAVGQVVFGAGLGENFHAGRVGECRCRCRGGHRRRFISRSRCREILDPGRGVDDDHRTRVRRNSSRSPSQPEPRSLRAVVDREWLIGEAPHLQVPASPEVNRRGVRPQSLVRLATGASHPRDRIGQAECGDGRRSLAVHRGSAGAKG